MQRLFAEAVHAALAEVVHVDAPKELFRIGEVLLPSSVISLSLESAIALQRNEILENTQQVVVIRSETDRIVAEIDAETRKILNFATNTGQKLIQDSKSFANQVEIRARAQGIAMLLEMLNFSSTAYTIPIVNRLAQLDNAQNTRYVTVPSTLVGVNG